MNTQLVFTNKTKPLTVWAFKFVLEWLVDPYQVSTNKPSGITSGPNGPNDAEYMVRLLGQVMTVSVETMKLVEGLPSLRPEGADGKS